MEENKNPFKEQESNETELDEQQAETIKEEATDSEDIETEKQDTDNKKADNDFEKKYNELNNTYIRLAADFDNFRKRTIQEKNELSKYTQAELLKKIIVTLDTFDRAQEQLKNVEDVNTVKNGYEVAIKQFNDVLSKIGIEEVDALGKEFNPNEHEAVTQVETDEYESDVVALVMQKGYKIADIIIRPALVGVAKKKEEQ